jgi:hypothetical protein
MNINDKIRKEILNMVYMTPNTYELISKTDSESLDNVDSNTLIELDEMIAPVIQVLNKKGYKTYACCSGHPYDVIDGTNDVVLTSYILFDGGIILPSCPEDDIIEAGTYADKKIRFGIRHYEEIRNGKTKYYQVFNKIIKIMKNWMKWAESLPVYDAKLASKSFVELLNNS